MHVLLRLAISALFVGLVCLAQSQVPFTNGNGVRNLMNTAETNRITQITDSAGRVGTAYSSTETETSTIRFHVNEDVVITFTGVGIEDGDKAFFVPAAQNDCVTENSPVTITGNRGTFNYGAAGEGMKLCYQFRNAATQAKDVIPAMLVKPFNYYGTLFRITVVTATALNHATNGESWKTAYANAQITPDLVLVGTGLRVGDRVNFGNMESFDRPNGRAETKTCALNGGTTTGSYSSSAASDGSGALSAGLKLLKTTRAAGGATGWQDGGVRYQICFTRVSTAGYPKAVWQTVPQTLTYFTYTADSLFSFFPRWIEWNTAAFAGRVRAAALHKGDTIYVSPATSASTNQGTGISAGAAFSTATTTIPKAVSVYLYTDGASKFSRIFFDIPVARTGSLLRATTPVCTKAAIDDLFTLNVAVGATTAGTCSAAWTQGDRVLTITWTGTWDAALVDSTTWTSRGAGLSSQATPGTAGAAGDNGNAITPTFVTNGATASVAGRLILRGNTQTCGEAIYGSGVQSGATDGVSAANAWTISEVTTTGVGKIAGSAALRIAGTPATNPESLNWDAATVGFLTQNALSVSLCYGPIGGTTSLSVPLNNHAWGTGADPAATDNTGNGLLLVHATNLASSAAAGNDGGRISRVTGSSGVSLAASTREQRARFAIADLSVQELALATLIPVKGTTNPFFVYGGHVSNTLTENYGASSTASNCATTSAWTAAVATAMDADTQVVSLPWGASANDADVSQCHNTGFLGTGATVESRFATQVAAAAGSGTAGAFGLLTPSSALINQRPRGASGALQISIATPAADAAVTWRWDLIPTTGAATPVQCAPRNNGGGNGILFGVIANGACTGGQETGQYCIYDNTDATSKARGFGAPSIPNTDIYYYDYLGAGQVPSRVAAVEYKVCVRRVNQPYQLTAMTFNIREKLPTVWPTVWPASATSGTTPLQIAKFYLTGGDTRDAFNLASGTTCVGYDVAGAATMTNIGAAVAGQHGYTAEVSLTVVSSATGSNNVNSAFTNVCYRSQADSTTAVSSNFAASSISLAGTTKTDVAAWTVAVGSLNPTLLFAVLSGSNSADSVSGDTLLLTFSQNVKSFTAASTAELAEFVTITWGNGKTMGTGNGVSVSVTAQVVTVTFGTLTGSTVTQADLAATSVAPTAKIVHSSYETITAATASVTLDSSSSTTATKTAITGPTPATATTPTSLWNGQIYTTYFTTSTVPLQNGDSYSLSSAGITCSAAPGATDGDVSAAAAVNIDWVFSSSAPAWRTTISPKKIVTSNPTPCFRYTVARGGASLLGFGGGLLITRVGGTTANLNIKYPLYDTFVQAGASTTESQWKFDLGADNANHPYTASSASELVSGYIVSTTKNSCQYAKDYTGQQVTLGTAASSIVTATVATHTVPSIGGAVALCYQMNGGGGLWYSLGTSTLSVVQINGVFPDFVLVGQSTPIWIVGKGLGSKAYFTNVAACESTEAADKSSSIGGMSQTINGATFTAGDYFLCYGGTTSLAPAPVASGVKGYWRTTFKVTAVAVTDTANKPITPKDTTANRFILKGNATELAFTDSGVGVWRSGVEFKFDTSGACSDSTAATISATITAAALPAPTVADLTVDSGTATTSVTGTVAGKDVYTLCMNDGVNTDKTKWYKPKTTAVTYHVAELTAVDKTYMVSSGTGTDKLVFTATGLGLNAADKWYFTAGTWCGAAGGLGGGLSSTAVGADEKSVTFEALGTTVSAGGDYSLCYQTGGVGVYHRHAIVPVTRFGTLFPNQVIASTAATETRALNWCGTNRYVDGTLGFSLTDCVSTAVNGPVAAGNTTYAIPVGDDKTLVTCFKHKSDAGTNPANFWNIASSGAILYTSKDLKLYISEPYVDYAGTRYVKLAHGVDTTVIFGTDGTKDSTALPTDKLAVIPNGRACADLNAATGAPTPLANSVVALFTATTCRHQFVLKMDENKGVDLPLCFQPVVAKVATKNDWAPFTTATNVRIAAVLNMQSSTNLVEPFNNLWTLMHNVNQVITFRGNWIDQDDFASFVAAYYNDCGKAWVYEHAVTATAAAENTGTANFKLPAGTYFLCYYFKGTNTGYKSYKGKIALAVKGIKAAMPLFTSAAEGLIGVATTTKFTFESLSQMPGSVLGPKDQVTFSTSTCGDSTGSDATKVYNLTGAGFMWNPSTAPFLAAGEYFTCWNFENSIFYNQRNINKNGFAANYFTSTFDMDLKQTAVKINVYDAAIVKTVMPRYVVAGVATDIMFGGGLLVANDNAALLPNSSVTCTNTTATQGNSAKMVQAGETGERNLVRWAGLKQDTTGNFPICYQLTQGFPKAAATNPMKLEADLSLEVVNVDSISPTHVTPTDAVNPDVRTGADASTTEITLTGYFGTAKPNMPDKAAFVDSYLNKDCSRVNARLSENAGMGNGDVQDLTWVDSKTSKARFNFTDFSGEFFLCVRFSGVGTWTRYSNINFSARRIDSVQSRSIEGSDAGTTEATVRFFGQGIRSFDRAVFIFSNVTAANIEKACTDEDKLTGQNVTVAVRETRMQWGVASAKFKLKAVRNMGTEYQLCYKFGSEVTRSGSSWEVLFKTYDGSKYDSAILLETRVIGTAADRIRDVRIVNGANVDRLATGDAAVTSGRPSNEVKDVSQPTTLYINGTGIMAGDSIRLIATSNATSDKECDPITASAGTEGTSVFMIAQDYMDMSVAGGANAARTLGYTPAAFAAKYRNGYVLNRAEEWNTVTVTGGELNPMTSYTVCYNKIRTSFIITTAAIKEVRGNWPRRVDADGATKTFTLFGDGIAAGDSGVFQKAGDKCDSTITASNVATVAKNAVTPDLEIRWTFGTATNDRDVAYQLCYRFTGGVWGPTTAAVFNGVCNATAPCPTSGQHRCGCTCQAMPCAPKGISCPNGGFACGTGGCYRSPRQCPRLTSTCASGVPCHDGSCAPRANLCPVVDNCPRTHVRCVDGSCARAPAVATATTTDPCVFKGKGITTTTAISCPTGTSACTDTGVCVPSGGVCPAYNGCPADKPFVCSDCGCAAKQFDCEAATLKNSTGYICTRNSQVVNERFGCTCFNAESYSEGSVNLKGTKIRRFVVRASAQISLDVRGMNFPMGDDIVANVMLDAGLSAADNCVLSYGRVPDSISRARENTKNNEYIAGAALHLALTDPQGVDCVLTDTTPTKNAIISYKKTTVPPSFGDSDFASLNCLNVLSTVTGETIFASSKSASGPASERTCVFSRAATAPKGTNAVRAVALYRGSAPGALPNAPVPSSPPPSPTPVIPGLSPTPGGGTTGTTASASSVAVSAFTLVVLAVLALAF